MTTFSYKLLPIDGSDAVINKKYVQEFLSNNRFIPVEGNDTNQDHFYLKRRINDIDVYVDILSNQIILHLYSLSDCIKKSSISFIYNDENSFIDAYNQTVMEIYTFLPPRINFIQ
jgi:hypothetical protein